MKNLHLTGFVVAGILTIAGTALAGVYSPPVQIAFLETATDGYVITPVAPINNPHACTDPSVVVGYSPASVADKDLMNKTLLSAFLANRSVVLQVASTVCSADNHPVYLSVRVNSGS